jgi:hypothetical protein
VQKRREGVLILGPGDLPFVLRREVAQLREAKLLLVASQMDGAVGKRMKELAIEDGQFSIERGELAYQPVVKVGV